MQLRKESLKNHQYEMTTLYSIARFWQRQKKSKNNFINFIKSSKEFSVVFLVEGEKFNLGEKISAKKFRREVQICLHLCCRFCCELSRHTGLSLEHFAAVSSPNIAELVPSCFFCPQPWFLRRSEHSLP